MKQAIAADVRVPQRHRHLRRPRRAASASTPTTTRREIEWLRELTRRRHRRLRHVHATTAWPGSARARGRGGLRPRDPRSRPPQVHDAVGQDRDLLDGARRQSRSLRPRPHPADPDLDPAGRGRSAPPAAAVHARSRGRGPTRSTATRRSWRGPTATMSGCTRRTPPRAASPTAQRVRVFNDRGADRAAGQGHATASRRASCPSRRARGSRRTPRAPTRRGCANVLTDDRSAPCGATTYNTCLVQVEPAPEHG